MATSCSEVRNSIRSLDHFDYRRFVRRTVPKYLSLLIMALVISGCQKSVSVPTVVTLDVEQAKQALAAKGLKPGNIIGPSGVGAYVTAQSLEGGKQVPRDTQVDLTVEMPQPLPDLTKMKVTDAVSMLQDMGMKVGFVKQSSLRLFSGSKVTAQSPLPTTPARRGQMVMITVAMPPDLGAFLGLVTKEPAYQKLNPEYKGILDQFLGAEGGQPQPQQPSR
jgi:beta-lactam-binding protein with PASTA domain